MQKKTKKKVLIIAGGTIVLILLGVLFVLAYESPQEATVLISKEDYAYLKEYFQDAKIEKLLCFKIDGDRIYDFYEPEQCHIDGEGYKMVQFQKNACNGGGNIHNHPRWNWQSPSDTDFYVWGQQEMKIAGLYRNFFDDAIFYTYNGEMVLVKAELVIV